jgi:hypothetical protein
LYFGVIAAQHRVTLTLLTPTSAFVRVATAAAVVPSKIACIFAVFHAMTNRWAQRRSGAVPPELIGRVAPTRTEGLNMRGVFSFPIEQYADQLLPSRVIPKMHLLGNKCALATRKNARFAG